MRVLLSTVGSRGDVQPMVALALYVRELGHDPRLCAPPGFDDLFDMFGLSYVPVGHDLRLGPKRIPGGVSETVAAQFAALDTAASGVDVIVGCAAMQLAARSIAQMLEIPYHYTAFAPVALPSQRHRPPLVHGPAREGVDFGGMWDQDAQWWNDTWREALNGARAAIDLQPVDDVRSFVTTDRPLLAADPTLAPWPTPSELDVVQTGAWMMGDRRALPCDLEAFLDAGNPPILFGFGSIRTPRISAPGMIAAARAIGYRAVILRGWAGLTADDDAPDWVSAGEVNLQALLGRVAAIVHHGGSGTTTQAMRAGTPQVVVPHEFDQPFFAGRVTALGIGFEHKPLPGGDSLAGTLDRALAPSVRKRARSLAGFVRIDGVAVAAREILQG